MSEEIITKELEKGIVVIANKEPNKEQPKHEEQPKFKGLVNGQVAKDKKYSGTVRGTCNRCHAQFNQLLQDENIKCPACQNKG